MHKVNIAVVGLGFGGAFTEIYRAHPAVGRLAVCDIRKELCIRARERIPQLEIFDSLEQILADPGIDAVHLATPIPMHGEQTLRILESGKHCAAAVPMSVNRSEAEKIAAAAKRKGKIYMLMETSVYTAHFMFAQDLLLSGELGRIQFLRGAHYQDMENWPSYWNGLPPMWYGTHAAAPLLLLANSPPVRVFCVGSGYMDASLARQYGNPYPVECAIAEFENGLKAEITRSLFETARQYSESFNIYGSRACFEWEQLEGEKPVLFRYAKGNPSGLGRDTSWERLTLPTYAERLPSSVRSFIGGGHDGSHPFLVHEFLSAIVSGVPPRENEDFALCLTKLLLAAHESAMNGAPVPL